MLNFAYGSNLLIERLQARVAQARFIATGRLPGWRFAFNVRSRDGSAKANALRTGQPNDWLHGVIYELDETGKATLDGYEDVGGAYRVECATVTTDRGPLDAYLYAGNDSHYVEGLAPYDWYLGFIIAGARQHCLPDQFIARLRSVATKRDPDSARAADNWKVIPRALRSPHA
jgi:gamma-glutamylcyclotransferase (GGCT)/AIG2-like uncharacterized protein YtfP